MMNQLCYFQQNVFLPPNLLLPLAVIGSNNRPFHCEKLLQMLKVGQAHTGKETPLKFYKYNQKKFTVFYRPSALKWFMLNFPLET